MAFSWSFSKIKAFDSCPKRHYEVDIARNYREDDTDQLKWGNAVHEEFAKTLKTGAPLPAELEPYNDKWIKPLQEGTGTLLVEQKYALTRDFQPCEYFGPRVWYRGICDALRLDPPVALAIDWKTGKVKHDATQLMLMAACIFATYPNIELIETRFIWLQDECVTRERYTRDDIAAEWARLLPRVAAYAKANETMTFPPKPGPLCLRYCPVTSCPFYKKAYRK